MNGIVVSRLFRLVALEPPQGGVARALVKCPRHRLVRAVAWYVRALTSDFTPTSALPGLRIVIRGWDDVYSTATVPRDAAPADSALARPRTALVTRHARVGRGWAKDPLPTIGAVRAETELAVRWLDRAIGCILHDDCVAVPELGAACATP